LINLFQRGLRSFHKNEIAVRFLKLFSVDVLAKASGYLLLPVYLRLMSPSEFGLFNYVLSVAGTLAIVFNFGLYAPQSKLIHEFRSPLWKGRVVFTIYALLFGGMLITLLPLFITGLDYRIIGAFFGLNEQYGKFRFWLCLAIVSGVFNFMLTNYFLATEQIRLTQTLNILRVLVINIIVLLCLYWIPVEKGLLRFQVATLVEFVLAIILSRHLVKAFRPQFSLVIAKKSIRLGGPLMLNAMLGIITNFADKWFLNQHYGFVSLSGYYLAFSLANLITFIYASFQNVWFPIFIQEKNLAALVQRSRKISRYLLWAALFIFVSIWGGAWIALRFEIIPLKYNAVMGILPLILIGQLLSCIAMFWGNYIVYFSATALIVKWGVIMATVSLLLNWLLISTFGTLGASISYVSVNIMFVLIYMTIATKKIHARLNFEKSAC